MINVLACPYPTLEPIFNLIKYLLQIVSVVIPIILIVLGTIDLSKAVIAKDDSEIKKNQAIFIKRCIYAVSIFFVYTLVMYIMGLVSRHIDPDADNFIECFSGEFEKNTNTNTNTNTNSNISVDDVVNYNLSYKDDNIGTTQRCCYDMTLKLKDGTFVKPSEVYYKFNDNYSTDGCREVESSEKCGIKGVVPDEVKAVYKGVECKILYNESTQKYDYDNPFCRYK